MVATESTSNSPENSHVVGTRNLTVFQTQNHISQFNADLATNALDSSHLVWNEELLSMGTDKNIPVTSDSTPLPQRVARVPRKLPSLTPVPIRPPKNTSTQSTNIPITTDSPLVTSLRKAFMDTPLHATDTVDPLREPESISTMPVLQLMESRREASFIHNIPIMDTDNRREPVISTTNKNPLRDAVTTHNSPMGDLNNQTKVMISGKDKDQPFILKPFLNTEIIVTGDFQLRRIKTHNIPNTWQMIAIGGGKLQHALRIMQHLPTEKSLNLVIMMGSNHMKDTEEELHTIMCEFLELGFSSGHRVLMIGPHISPQLKPYEQMVLDKYNQMLLDRFKDDYLPPSPNITITLVDGIHYSENGVTEVWCYSSSWINNRIYYKVKNE